MLNYSVAELRVMIKSVLYDEYGGPIFCIIWGGLLVLSNERVGGRVTLAYDYRLFFIRNNEGKITV